MIGDIENPNSNDPLDHAIRDAMRIDLDEQRVAHLEGFWRVQSQREKWRRNVRRITAPVAAAIALVAIVVIVRHRDAQPRQMVHAIKDSPKGNDELRPTKPSVANHMKRRVPLELPGRAPTAYEQLVFMAGASVETQPKTNASAIDNVIQEVAANADADPAGALNSSGIKRATAESILLRRLPHTTAADQQEAILRLLAVCGSQRSVPAILRLAQNESLRTVAFGALERIVGINGLAQVVENSPSPNVRPALMLRLLTADSPAGLLGYLSLVRNEATRTEALAVAKNATNPPIEQLLSLLSTGDESVRVAAAITLGRINGPTTTRLLIARITGQPANLREAWLALMECRGETAREFLDYATRRPELLGYYNNARVRWSQMIQ